MEGWRNKGKKIPAESLLRQWQKDNTRCHLQPRQFPLSYSVPNVASVHHLSCTQTRNPDRTNFDSSPSLARSPSPHLPANPAQLLLISPTPHPLDSSPVPLVVIRCDPNLFLTVLRFLYLFPWVSYYELFPPKPKACSDFLRASLPAVMKGDWLVSGGLSSLICYGPCFLLFCIVF